MGCLPRRENSVRGVGRLSFRRTHKSSGNEGSSSIEDTEKRSEFPLDSEDKPPLSYCLWLSTEIVFESLLGSASMTL
jgi:hypothetical protein